MENKQFDICICGGGLAGLSLAYRALQDGVWNDLNIAIVDPRTSYANDKTWSFWEKETGIFESILSHKWDKLRFFANTGNELDFDHGKYAYKTIRSEDFYAHCISFLKRQNNVSFVQDKVKSIKTVKDLCRIELEKQTLVVDYCFNSIFDPTGLSARSNSFIQHFLGWRIKTEEFKEPADAAILMDFRTNQSEGTTFVYTLPFAQNEIFVEYTLFSKQILPREKYETGLKDYLREALQISEYTILETEYGEIPMTDFRFDRFVGREVRIGTAGGDTRGSTGYTFTNIQKTIGKIIASWKENQTPYFEAKTINKRHQLFDGTLLGVLDRGQYNGSDIFADLFSNLSAEKVLDFLNGDSLLLDDIKLMMAVRPLPFLKPFFKQLIQK